MQLHEEYSQIHCEGVTRGRMWNAGKQGGCDIEVPAEGICTNLALHAGAARKQWRARERPKRCHDDAPVKKQQWRSSTRVHKSRGGWHHLAFLTGSSGFCRYAVALPHVAEWALRLLWARPDQSNPTSSPFALSSEFTFFTRELFRFRRRDF